MNELRMALVEVMRELQVRQHVYPRLVEMGRLTQGEADRRMRAMRLALYHLETAAAGPDPVQPTTGE
jgi:hypothetical protein